LRGHGHQDAQFVGDRARLPAAALAKLRDGDIVLTLGAGDITRLGPELLAALGKKSTGKAR
jgi:UDP-N-acetylmuramate--alanine ligase